MGVRNVSYKKKACSHKGQVSQPLIQTHIHIDTNTEERDTDKATHTQSNNLSQTERNEEKNLTRM